MKLSNDTKLRMGREFVGMLEGWLLGVDNEDYIRGAPDDFRLEIATTKRQVAEVKEWLEVYAK